jgi:hypothetical protein
VIYQNWICFLILTVLIEHVHQECRYYIQTLWNQKVVQCSATKLTYEQWQCQLLTYTFWTSRTDRQCQVVSTPILNGVFSFANRNLQSSYSEKELVMVSLGPTRQKPGNHFSVDSYFHALSNLLFTNDSSMWCYTVRATEFTVNFKENKSEMFTWLQNIKHPSQHFVTCWPFFFSWFIMLTSASVVLLWP